MINNVNEASMLLDTNMLLAAVQFKADIFAKNSFTLSSCIDELKKLSKGKSKDVTHKRRSRLSTDAKLMLELLKKNKIPVSATAKKGDAAIIDYATKRGCAVATNDKELIEKLKQRKVKVYRLRQKKMLVEA